MFDPTLTPTCMLIKLYASHCCWPAGLEAQAVVDWHLFYYYWAPPSQIVALPGHSDQSCQSPDMTELLVSPGTRWSQRDLTSLSGRAEQIKKQVVSEEGKTPRHWRKWSAPSQPEAWSPWRTPWRRQNRTCTGRAWGLRHGGAAPRTLWAAPSSSCPPTLWPPSPWTLGRKSRSKDKDQTETDQSGLTMITMLFHKGERDLKKLCELRRHLISDGLLPLGMVKDGDFDRKCKMHVSSVCNASIWPHGGELGWSIDALDITSPSRGKPKTDTNEKRFKLLIWEDWRFALVSVVVRSPADLR